MITVILASNWMTTHTHAQNTAAQAAQAVITCVALWDVRAQVTPQQETITRTNTRVLVWQKLTQDVNTETHTQMLAYRLHIAQNLMIRIQLQPAFVKEIERHTQECDHVLESEVSERI